MEVYVGLAGCVFLLQSIGPAKDDVLTIVLTMSLPQLAKTKLDGASDSRTKVQVTRHFYIVMNLELHLLRLDSPKLAGRKRIFSDLG